MRRSHFAMVAASLVFAAVGPAPAQTPSDGVVIKTDGKLTAPLSEEDGKPRGVSGMACLKAGTDGARACALVVDEEIAAERAILAGDALTFGKGLLRLSRDEKSDKGLLGTRQVAPCGDEKSKIGEFDGEGIAVTDGFLYITGSHGCSGKDNYKPDSYMIARYALTADGTAIDATKPVERSLRVADLLKRSPVAQAFGKEKGKGVNIEGLAGVGDTLFFGLRTPAEGTKTWILRVSAKALFAPGTAALAAEAGAGMEVTLEANTGVRDMAALADGRLLLLTGPAREEAGAAYAIRLLGDPMEKSATPRLVATLAPQTGRTKDGKPETGKAETLVVLAQDAAKKTASVLVLYDNVDEGGARRHDIALD